MVSNRKSIGSLEKRYTINHSHQLVRELLSEYYSKADHKRSSTKKAKIKAQKEVKEEQKLLCRPRLRFRTSSLKTQFGIPPYLHSTFEVPQGGTVVSTVSSSIPTTQQVEANCSPSLPHRTRNTGDAQLLVHPEAEVGGKVYNI
ncbi:Hypothetical predicted protein [Pelobates cultripes]|uniref:Uncharacterized protein n=1 Tax=Pelobates cultripes TaxID=61616 RepID=A0AAD1QXZ6_PELCU|nr:Hypothetical predicted protein [Pelobates cultripes]